MHYHYFTLEQRKSLEGLIAARLPEGEKRQSALERLHGPDYGVCERCGADIPFASLAADPMLRRCRGCQD
jgi:RNA polymerase-binding transcription factor DksA